MRINRLDLTRYGKFTDYVIDFGVPLKEPDLHIIYGPNEAGKSTLLAALLDLLFGIENKSRYSFLHDYKTMCIGAQLESQGVSHEIIRIKARQNSLLNQNKEPISDNIVQTPLGGVDREAYTTMFSLDDETLEAGGENILASKGDLGQLLFSASTGISNLAQKLDGLRVEADKIFKPRASKIELAVLKNRLSELQQKRKAIDIAANTYAQLKKEKEQVSAQYQQALVERGQVKAQLDQLQRQLGAIPQMLALSETAAELQPLLSLPEVPLGAAELLLRLQNDAVSLNTKKEAITAEVSKVSRELEQYSVDEALLTVSSRVQGLALLNSRYQVAETALPTLMSDLQTQERLIAAGLCRIERKGHTPEALLLPVSMTSVLHELIEKYSVVSATFLLAEEELLTAKEYLLAVNSQLEALVSGSCQADLEATPRALTHLDSLIKAISASDHDARQQHHTRQAEQHQLKLTERLQVLRPWQGTAEALLELSVPDAIEIERWQTLLTQLEKKLERCAAEQERAIKEEQEQAIAIKAMSQAYGFITDEQAAKVRSEREAAWCRHKQTLDSASAQVFETILREDDLVTHARVVSTLEAAAATQLKKTYTIAKETLEKAQQEYKLAEAEMEEARGKIHALMKVVCDQFPADFSINQFSVWLDDRRLALESVTALSEARCAVSLAQKDADQHRRRLFDAMIAIGLDCPTDASQEKVIIKAQVAFDRAKEKSDLQGKVNERKSEVERRERKVQSAQQAMETWQQQWLSQCAKGWLGEVVSDKKIPPIEMVREVLAVLDGLGKQVDKRNALTAQLKQFENDQKVFVQEVQSLSAELLRHEGLPPQAVAVVLLEELEVAKAVKQDRKNAIERLEDAKTRMDSLSKVLLNHRSEKEAFLKKIEVETLEAAQDMLGRLDRRKTLQKQVRQVEQDIVTALSVATLEQARQLLDTLDRAEAEAKINILNSRYDALDQRVQQLFGEEVQACDKLKRIDDDGNVATIEESRKTTLLEISEAAKRYLKLRLGVVAAEQALRLYRDKHRGSMMAQASEAFSAISRGAYVGLTTQPDKENEILVALSSSEGSKVTSMLSKGTRFQLYLALRVAGYLEFSNTRPALPFIADDIMETFDDFRSEEAFKLMAKMARKGQVIYLTHHQHLCETARRVCSNVKVHDLSGH